MPFASPSDAKGFFVFSTILAESIFSFIVSKSRLVHDCIFLRCAKIFFLLHEIIFSAAAIKILCCAEFLCSGDPEIRCFYLQIWLPYSLF